MAIAELGHVGVYVYDLPKMRDFYMRVMGLHIADETENVCFMTARPGVEHHEFVLGKGRDVPMSLNGEYPPGSKAIQQVSFRVDDMETLVDFHHRFKAEGIAVQQEITHGNSYSIYFWDPEGNRVEVYVRVPKNVRQPFIRPLNFDQSPEDIVAEAEAKLAAEPEFIGASLGGDLR